MELALVDSKLQSKGTVEAADALFNRAWNKALVHRLAEAHGANGRSGTRKQKTRAEVHHTTRKLFRQKGTGRARAGMSSSPIRRGGGRAFPASPKDNLRKELNRKEFRAGMACLLSQIAREGRIFVAEELASAAPKTAPCAQMIAGFAGADRILFVDTEFDTNFALSSRNLHKASLVESNSLLSLDLLGSERTVISKRALEELTRRWS